MASENQINPF